MTIMNFAKTALKNLFSEPATRAYPLQPREYPERTRGHIENDMDVCVLCGLCSKKCPADAITVDRAAGTWSIMPYGCIQCNCCVESCPKKCLSMKQTYTQPAAHKEVHTFTKPVQPKTEPTPAPGADKKGA